MIKKVCVIICFAIIVGCSPSYDEKKGYTASSLSVDFPIPENAVQVEEPFYNPNIAEGASYELKGIGGRQGLYYPEAYFNEIEQAGWVKQEDKQLGAVSFFLKDEVEVAVVLKEDEFSIYKMKN